MTGCAKSQPEEIQMLLPRLPDNPQETGYGYSKNDPILVGGLPGETLPAKERHYLRRLKGPNGESLAFFRAGSCCDFV